MSYESKSERLEARWWIKWWTKDTLYGSFGGAPLDELGFFLKLCCLSQEGRFPGFIQANEEGEGLRHGVIAGMLQLEGEEFERLLSQMKEQDRVSENERGKITINKFRYFQKVRGIPTTKSEGEALKTLQASGMEIEAGGEVPPPVESKYKKGKFGHIVCQTAEEVAERRETGRKRDVVNRSPRPLPKEYTKPEDL